jgi:hypothetical protein
LKDNKNAHGHQIQTPMSGGTLHWPPVLTPSDFSKPTKAPAPAYADHYDHSIAHKECTNAQNSEGYNELNSPTKGSAPNTGPTQTATPNSYPSLHPLPAPALYQCLSCGQLNPTGFFPRAEGDDCTSYFLVGSNSFQGFKAENQSMGKEGNL